MTKDQLLAKFHSLPDEKQSEANRYVSNILYSNASFVSKITFSASNEIGELDILDELEKWIIKYEKFNGEIKI